MASLTRWTWVWVISGNWWWTGRAGILRFMGLTEGETESCSDRWAMLGKSLIQFSVDGQGCFLPVVWPETKDGGGNGPPSKGPVQALLRSVPPTLQQATTDPRLRWRLQDTHRQVWVSFLWGHCSFHLGPGAHNVLSVSSKSLFLLSCESSIIKSHWPAKSNSLRFSIPLPDPQVGNSVVSPKTCLTVWEFLWCNCSAVCGPSAWLLYGEVNVDLLQEGLCHRLCDQVSCTQSPWPYGRPLLTCTSAGALKYCSGSVSMGPFGPGVHNVLFEPSEGLWRAWSLILNVISPLHHLSGTSPLPLDMGYHFLVWSNILLSMVVQQWVVILEFLQKISTCPCTPTS